MKKRACTYTYNLDFKVPLVTTTQALIFSPGLFSTSVLIRQRVLENFEVSYVRRFTGVSSLTTTQALKGLGSLTQSSSQ
jgi:hypothetical protein